MRILITGGAGYIGSVLTPALLAKGYEVTVLDNFTYRQNSLMDCCRYETFQVVRGDCRRESVVKGLLAKADVIIPLAAMVGAPLCDRDRGVPEAVTHLFRPGVVSYPCSFVGTCQAKAASLLLTPPSERG